VWITYIEGLHLYQQSIEAHLDRLAKEEWFFATSEAVKLEILPKLYAAHNDKIIALYQALFDNLTLLDNFPELFKEALIVTQQEGLKAMDAIHVAIAKQQGC
jgi:predicted nucleic acid-binding protein